MDLMPIFILIILGIFGIAGLILFVSIVRLLWRLGGKK